MRPRPRAACPKEHPGEHRAVELVRVRRAQRRLGLRSAGEHQTAGRADARSRRPAASTERFTMIIRGIDHVEYYVADLEKFSAVLRDGYGFELAGQQAAGAERSGRRSVLLRQGEIALLLT